MKTNLKIYFAACSVMAALGSCNQEAVMEGASINQDKEARTIAIHANLGMDSRIAFEENETNLNLLWEENDGFSVMVGKEVQTPVTFTLTEGEGTSNGKFEGNIHCNDGDTLYAVWPIMENGMSGEHQCYWSLAGQKGVLDDKYTFMIGSFVYEKNGNNSMAFRPMTAALRLHLLLPEDVEKIYKVDLIGEMLGREGATVNIDSGGLLLDGSTRNDGVTIENEFTVIDGAIDVVAYFFAWDWTYLKNAKVVVTSNNGKQYEGALVDGNLRPGKLYDTTVDLRNSGVETVTIQNTELSTALQAELGADNVTINSNGYAVMTKEFVESVTELSFESRDKHVITSLAGIEHFKNLQDLRCDDTQLQECDLNQNKALRNVSLCYQLLSKFVLNGMHNLVSVNLGFTQWNLTEVNLDGNANLEIIDLTCCSELTELSMSGCNKVYNLDLRSTKISTIDIPVPNRIWWLGCAENLQIDWSQFTSLSTLWMWGMTDDFLASIPDFVKERLENFHCGQGRLTYLDLSKFENLRSLSCFENQLTALDTSHNPYLRELNCENNRITNLDLTSNTSLDRLNCGLQKDSEGNDIVLYLKLPDNLVERWTSEWMNENENVQVVTGPSVEPGNGNTGGSDFTIEGIY